MATYKKKDNNEKTNFAPANEDDFFSVSNSPSFLNRPTAKRRAALTKSDNEKVIEPLDEDAKTAEKDTASGTAPEAEKDPEVPAKDDESQSVKTQTPQVSGDEFLSQLYKEAQSDISSELDAIKNECRLYVPETVDDSGESPKDGASQKAVPRGPSRKSALSLTATAYKKRRRQAFPKQSRRQWMPRAATAASTFRLTLSTKSPTLRKASRPTI